MDFLLQNYNWVFLLMASLSGALLLWPTLSGKTTGVGAAEAVRLMNREKALVIDVSEPEEFAKAHVVGARNLPVGQIEANAKGLPGNKQQALVVVCPSGARANRAAAQLKKLGYEKVSVLQGGLASWREANLPLEKAAA